MEKEQIHPIKEMEKDQESITDVMIDVKSLTSSILATLDARSKDVVMRRFGLNGKGPETLESIGKEYGITRERVRQIEANAKKVLLKVRDQLTGVESEFTKLFNVSGGLVAPSYFSTLASKVTDEMLPHLVNFYLEILPEYTYVAKSKTFYPHWKHEASLYPHMEDIVLHTMEILDEAKKPLSIEEIMIALTTRLETELVSQDFVVSALTASKFVDKTVFNQWGLAQWAETSPRGVADKAFAVLRHKGKPAHFREITSLINEIGFDAKKANPQTVHNELIKDSRFVLVGRGLYALTEWGYMTGTVGDVLETILREEKTPLTKEELIEKVSAQRLVKKNTILLSLQNTKRFTKDDHQRYSLVE